MRRAPASLVVGIAALVATALVGMFDTLFDPAPTLTEHGLEVHALATVAIGYAEIAINFAAYALCAHGAWRLADRSHGVERAAALATAAACALVVALTPLGMILPRLLGPADYLRALTIQTWAAWALVAIVRGGRLLAICRRAPPALLAVSAIAVAVLTVAWMPSIDALRVPGSALGDAPATVIGTALLLIDLGAFGRALLVAQIAEPSHVPARAAGGLRAIALAALLGYAAIVVLVIGTIAAARGWAIEVELLRRIVPSVTAVAAFAAAAGALRASDTGLDARASIGLAVTALIAFAAIWFQLAAFGFADRPYGGEVGAFYANAIATVTWSAPLCLAAIPIAVAAAIDRVAPASSADPWPPAVGLAGIVIALAAESAHLAGAAFGAVVLVVALGVALALAIVVRRIASHLGGMPSLPSAVARDRS